jgi:hypothetical protein
LPARSESPAWRVLRECRSAAGAVLDDRSRHGRRPAPARREPHPSGWQLFLTIAGLVALVNAVIVGAAGAIMIDAITDHSLAPSHTVGVPAGILALLLEIGYLRRSQSRVDGEIRDEFAVVAPTSDPLRPRIDGPVG